MSPTTPLGHSNGCDHVRVNGAVILERTSLGEEEHEGLALCNGTGSVEDTCITGNCMRGITRIGPYDLRPYLNVQCARLKRVFLVFLNNLHGDSRDRCCDRGGR